MRLYLVPVSEVYVKTKKVKEYEVVIRIPVATFDKKEFDIEYTRRKLIDSYIDVLIQGNVLIDEEGVSVEITGG